MKQIYPDMQANNLQRSHSTHVAEGIARKSIPKGAAVKRANVSQSGSILLYSGLSALHRPLCTSNTTQYTEERLI